MSPENQPPSHNEEPALRAAFAELHRRECAEAPPWEAMQDGVWREMQRPRGNARPASFGDRPSNGVPLPAFARLLPWSVPAFAALVLAVFWAIGHFATPPHPAFSEDTHPAAQHVEQLLDSIQSQLEDDDPIGTVAYPTDALLSQSDAEFPL